MSSSAQAYVPQRAPTRAGSLKGPVVVWSVVMAGALGVLGLIVGAPLARAHGYNLLALPIYEAFSFLCHQIPERSFHVEGHSFAVCARCTGIYAGFAMGVLIYPLMRSVRQLETPRRLWLLAAGVPLLIDWSLGFFRLWENTHLSRFATGALLGAVCAFYIVPGLVDLSLSGWAYLFPARRVTTASADSRHVADVRLTTSARTAPSDYSSPSSRI
jgi:uncharacterized membrane protein